MSSLQKTLLFSLFAVAALILAVPPQYVQGQARPKMEGEWRVSYVKYTSGSSSWTIDTPAPTLAVFGEKYYSISGVPEPDRPADLIPFVGTAGTYEMEGSTLVLQPSIARGAAAPAARLTQETRVLDNNLFLTYKQGDATIVVRLTRLS